MCSPAREGESREPEGGAHFVENRWRSAEPLGKQRARLALELLLDQPHFIGGRCFTQEQVGATRAWRPSKVLRVDSVGCAVSTGPNVEREHRLLDRIGGCAEFSELAHRPPG